MKGYTSLLTAIEVLKLKPAIIAHEDYQDFVMEQLRKYYLGKQQCLQNNLLKK